MRDDRAPASRRTGLRDARPRPSTAEPRDVERAAHTIPRVIGDDDTSSVDPCVWLWHVGYERRRSRELRTLLVAEYTPYAWSLARRSYHHREPLDDLRQVALLALIGALDRFQCERSIPFTGFATPTIIGALKRHHRDNDWAMRIPRQAHSVATALADAESRLDARNHGRGSSPAELAAELGIDEDDLERARAALQARATRSLDAPVIHGSSAVIEVGVAEEGYGQAEARVDLLGAVGDLSAPALDVLARYYLHGHTQREIGQELGVSQMQVSRTLRSAVSRLQARMEVDDRAPCRPRAHG